MLVWMASLWMPGAESEHSGLGIILRNHPISFTLAVSVAFPLPIKINKSHCIHTMECMSQQRNHTIHATGMNQNKYAGWKKPDKNAG